MDYQSFYNWLITEKAMNTRSAKDVISRCKRICNMLSADTITVDSLDELNSNEQFCELTMFIKSQLRRAVALWNEYGGKR